MTKPKSSPSSKPALPRATVVRGLPPPETHEQEAQQIVSRYLSGALESIMHAHPTATVSHAVGLFLRASHAEIDSLQRSWTRQQEGRRHGR